MDETVRIYQPKNDDILMYDSLTNKHYLTSKSKLDEVRKVVNDVIPDPENKTPKRNADRKESYLETLVKVFKDADKKEKRLMLKHPWVPIIYNWIVIACVVALFISFFLWGLDIRIRTKAEALTASAMAEVQAEADAQEAARLQALAAEQASEDYIVKQMATAVSKLYYGIRNFEEKYHYGEADFETYSRCAFNRVENKSYPNDLIEVINQKDQWIGYNEDSPVIDRYYILAEKHIRAWRNETTKPITTDYVYAELTANGVYLKNDYNANGYAIRWRAQR